MRKLKTKSGGSSVDPVEKNIGAKKKPQGETMSLHFVIDYIAHCSGVGSKGETPGDSEMVALSQYVALATPPPTTEEEKKKPTTGVAVSDPFFYGNGESRDYDVNFGNTQLPVRTIFDALGWVLSITATVDAEDALTPSNFYLPLMGLYAKWCDTLMDGDYQPTMLHIAWWGKSGEEKVLLGATPGGEHSVFNPTLNGALKGSGKEGNLRDTDKARREAKKAKKDAAKAKLDEKAPAAAKGDSGETKAAKTKARKEEEKRMKEQDDIDTAKASKEASALETRYEGFRGLDVLGVRQNGLKERGVNPPAGEEGQTLEALLTTKLRKKLNDPDADPEANEKIIDDLDNKMFEEGNTGYGRCAETFIYLVMGAERYVPHISVYICND